MNGAHPFPHAECRALRRIACATRAVGVLVLSLLLQFTQAHAQPIPIVARIGPMPAEAGLTLGPGDRITVTVFGQPDLSGDQTLDGQGSIRLPIGGVIEAANLTAAEIERKITEALADGYFVRPEVSVRISELRPVYLLGDVRSAGAVPYRYGMTALTAISLGGGFASARADSFAFRSDLLEVEQRLRMQEDQRLVLRARIARLSAQRDEAPTFEFPADLQTPSPAMLKVTAGERAVFTSEHDAVARQLVMLEQQIKDNETVLASISEQRRLARQQMAIVASYLADLSKLARNGLVERRRVVDMQQEQARLEVTVAQLDTESMRAAQLIREAPLRMAEVRAAARQRALLGLQEANSRLAELDTSIEASRELAVVRRQRVGASTRSDVTGRTQILVTRAGPNGPSTFQGEETTALQPGDVVRVSEGAGAQYPDLNINRTLMAQPGRP